MKLKAVAAATLVALTSVVGTAHAAFQGRLADFTPSASCTATGPDKCTYFYDTTLDITILNNWNIGIGTWSASAAPGSAQAVAAAAGFAASGLSGWVLPTGDLVLSSVGGAQNQYLSIWNSVGGTFSGLTNQFDGVRDYYWSSSEANPPSGNGFYLYTATGFQGPSFPINAAYAVAVRPGDVAAPIPEPQTYAMMLLGMTVLMVAVRRRQG